MKTVKTTERLKARLDKFSKWVAQVDVEIADPRHHDVVSGVDGSLYLIRLALTRASETVLDVAKMALLKWRLKLAGVSNSLPVADPRLLDIKPQESVTTDAAADGAGVDEDSEEKARKASDAVERTRRLMLADFQRELTHLMEVLPSIKVKILVEMRDLRKERRELAGFRDSFRNLLRDRSAGAKAAFERMAKGDPAPSWCWHGNVK